MSLFITEIYQWYSKNKRDLPWRKTNDPYKIWISEIILQQTRVAQGTNYYLRFIERFPNIKNLALASEDEVLKLWQGLGYYSRARNLHATAIYIYNVLNGQFPGKFEDIIKLKGIGPYTAAAIASIAFNLPYPAVDGNIYRLFSRYFGIKTPVDSETGKKEIYKIASEIMPEKFPGMHNQAMMEFGALQCIPKSPDCKNCPLLISCYAGKHNLADKFPVKAKKTKQSVRYFYFYYFEWQNSTIIEKRTTNDIWKNLYQFPLYETEKELTDAEIITNKFPEQISSEIKFIKILGPKKHILSHQIIHSKLIHLEIKNVENLSDQFIRVNKKDIFTFAVPRLMEHFINELDLK